MRQEGKADEFIAVLKRGENLFELRKLRHVADLLTDLGNTKYMMKTRQLAGTAMEKLQSMNPAVYRKILNYCDNAPSYRTAYATAGVYSNPVIDTLSRHTDELDDLSKVSSSLTREVVEEVTKAGSRSADNLDDIAREALDNARKRADEIVENIAFGAKQYIEKVLDKVKVAGKYQANASASDILRNELYEAGIPNPPYKNAAHHIVPWNDTRATNAREILDDFGIEYNSAANGVFLPMEYNEYVGDAVQHIGNHGPEYVNFVTTRLQEVVYAGGDVEDIVAVLNDIRVGLLDGSIKLN